MSNQNPNDRKNGDELEIPQWLNEEFFKHILKNNEQDKSIMITKTSITPGSGKAEHYGSVMFRAKLNYNTSKGDEKTTSMIIKTAVFSEGEQKEHLDKFDVFETEIKMFAEVLPEIERILKSNGDDTKLGANLLYSSLEPHKCLIFEDLCETGYTTIDFRYPTTDEVKLAFLKLAKLHAVSYKLAKEGDTLITSFKNGSFSDDKMLSMPIIADSVKTIKEILAEEKDLAYFVPLFDKIENKIFTRMIATFNAYQNGERDGIFVLNHGDFHKKNMMIAENDGRLKDLMLVDYQMSVMTTAAVDVLYALVMLLSPDMRLNQRDEWIYYYFTNFQNTLKMIDFKGKIPKLIDFQQEMLNHSHYELFLVISFLIFSHVVVDADGDLGKSIEDENHRRTLFKRPEIMQEFRILLPRFLHQGYFDF